MTKKENKDEENKTLKFSEGKGYVTMEVDPFKATQNNNNQENGDTEETPNFF